MASLHIERLAKAFGSHAVLSDVNLAVASGQFVAILGASGSGKTTLLRLIGGFERANAGTIVIDGRLVSGSQTHVPAERRQIGYVPQEGALFPHLSVADNIVFGLPRQRRRVQHRVAELLELVGLPTSFADRPPQALSGGEQQRVALARALAPEPKLVLLDEPFSALDAALRIETREAVAAALSTAGATTLLVTHDQAEALSMADRVAVLREGQLVQLSDPVTLYRQPRDTELARFVGEAVILPGVASKGRAICALGALRIANQTPDGPVTVLVRPEQIQLTTAAASGIRAQVQDVTFYGHDASVSLRLLDQAQTGVIARVPGYASPKTGTEVALHVDGQVTVWTCFGKPESSR